MSDKSLPNLPGETSFSTETVKVESSAAANLKMMKKKHALFATREEMRDSMFGLVSQREETKTPPPWTIYEIQSKPAERNATVETEGVPEVAAGEKPESKNDEIQPVVEDGTVETAEEAKEEKADNADGKVAADPNARPKDYEVFIQTIEILNDLRRRSHTPPPTVRPPRYHVPRHGFGYYEMPRMIGQRAPLSQQPIGWPALRPAMVMQPRHLVIYPHPVPRPWMMIPPQPLQTAHHYPQTMSPVPMPMMRMLSSEPREGALSAPPAPFMSPPNGHGQTMQRVMMIQGQPAMYPPRAMSPGPQQPKTGRPITGRRDPITGLHK